MRLPLARPLPVLALAMSMVIAPATGYAQSTLEQILERGRLLAGVRFDAPPSGYVDANGNNLGFGPDIARALAARLGVDVEFVQSTSRTRIPLLLNHQIDAEFDATTPTKSRDEVVDFSYTYNLEQSVILVRAGEPTEPADYFGTDSVIGGLQGAFFTELWRAEDPNAVFREYQEFPELVLALANGQVDVVPAPRVLARSMIERLGERAANIELGGVFYQDPHAIIVRENDSDWRDWVNWALQRMWQDGTFQEIYHKHYDADPVFSIGDAGRLQPGVEVVGEESDPWAEPIK